LATLLRFSDLTEIEATQPPREAICSDVGAGAPASLPCTRRRGGGSPLGWPGRATPPPREAICSDVGAGDPRHPSPAHRWKPPPLCGRGGSGKGAPPTPIPGSALNSDPHDLMFLGHWATPKSARRRIVALRPKAILGDPARSGGPHGGVPSRGIVGPVRSRRAFRLIPALLLDSDALFPPAPG
jgi:hypothetical protein